MQEIQLVQQKFIHCLGDVGTRCPVSCTSYFESRDVSWGIKPPPEDTSTIIGCNPLRPDSDAEEELRAALKYRFESKISLEELEVAENQFLSDQEVSLRRILIR